jgi:shikimate kinase
MMSRNLCLIGMMGSGKSTVAAVLGQRLGRRVVDTDEEIRRWTGSSIPELFAAHGEAGFRDLERQVVEQLAMLHHLDVPPEVIVQRLRAEGGDDRPLLAGDLEGQVHATHAARVERYRSVADVSVDASGTPDDVAAQIVAWAMEQGDVLTPSEHEQVMT